ncbi:hypothetical protein [Colwellia piezophila]|uniref:hypothetical protein n=1 Tax=Colwellia piezophila TaxID=211668 RepID=UPI000372451A|nr:hypothetical protein [Colwellia piezophila]
MIKYIKALSLVLVLAGSVYLPSAYAGKTNDMLITIAETDPVLVDRLNDIALNDALLLKKILQMADAKVEQLERLLDLAEYDPETLDKLITIYNAKTAPEQELQQPQMSTFGTINDGGGIIRN